MLEYFSYIYASGSGYNNYSGWNTLANYISLSRTCLSDIMIFVDIHVDIGICLGCKVNYIKVS